MPWHPFKLLPNELLHSIVEYIAYTPIMPMLPLEPDSFSNSPSHYCPSRELLALSVLDWRLRRVCLPFLFKKIKVRDGEDAEKMKDYLVLFARFTRTLAIGPFDALTLQGDEAISRILPQLEHLAYVELQQSSGRDRTILLRKLLVHPTVISVLVRDIPDESICDEDLSKLILDRASWDSYPREHLERGMKLERLNILMSFDNQLSESDIPTSFESQLIKSEMFSGLKELHITMSDAVSSSFLSALLSTYPTLEELWLVDQYGHQFDDHTPSCISSSVEESQWPYLTEHALIRRIGLRRAIGQSSDEWYIMGIAMEVTANHTNNIILTTLAVVASSFPTVENVTVHLFPVCYGSKEPCIHAKDFATVLAQFPSLKQLLLSRPHTRLDVDIDLDEKLSAQCRIGFNTPFFEEFMALWCTAWIATEIRSLHAIYIEDTGRDCLTLWHLEGWLHVKNSDRDIGGTLIRRRTRNSVRDEELAEVLLKSSMLSI
ncbi:hypothetical protein FB446DRAFT_735020 [Lentinula raphanica]|nr:hypothetical protein FB446DRAFT_735020 [Lentinula raphanica]